MRSLALEAGAVRVPVEQVGVERVALIEVAPERLAGDRVVIAIAAIRVRDPSGQPVRALALHHHFDAAREPVERFSYCVRRPADDAAVDDARVGARAPEHVRLLAIVDRCRHRTASPIRLLDAQVELIGALRPAVRCRRGAEHLVEVRELLVDAGAAAQGQRRRGHSAWNQGDVVD